MTKKNLDKEKLNVQIIRRETDDFTDVFGLLKGKLKKSAQQLKDESRDGWK